MLFREFPLDWDGQSRCAEVTPTSSSNRYPLSPQFFLLRSVCHTLLQQMAFISHELSMPYMTVQNRTLIERIRSTTKASRYLLQLPKNTTVFVLKTQRLRLTWTRDGEQVCCIPSRNIHRRVYLGPYWNS